MKFNPYIESLTPSKSMAMSMLAKELKKKDPSIIDLSIGEPDFDTPKAVVEEAIKWLNAGFTHYTTGPGLPELREAIAAKLQEDNGCSYDASEIIVTPSGKYGLCIALQTLLSAGDEAIVFAPYWVSYPALIESNGAKCVSVELTAENDYRIEEESLRAACTEKTRVIIINYPNNPTGMSLTEPELAAIKNVMKDFPEITLISDEMYESIIFDGRNVISPAADPDLQGRVITSNGFSKCAAMTGWRIGYIAGPLPFIKVATRYFGHTVSQTCGFIQKAAVVALTCKDEMKAMRESFQYRRDLFVDALNEIPGITCRKPEGAFYAWAGFDQSLIEKLPGYEPGKAEYSSEVSEFLLRTAKVSTVPGIANGVTGTTYVRFCFAAAEEDLKSAAAQIKAAIEAL